MPEPDGGRLGSAHVRLEADVVQFLPSRVETWRGLRSVSLPYAQVASLVMTVPEGFSRGHFIVRLDNGESLEMFFGANRLPKMTRTYRELWRRVRAARGDEPSAHE